MGWWGIGDGGDMLGDSPADILGDLRENVGAMLAKEGLHGVQVRDFLDVVLDLNGRERLIEVSATREELAVAVAAWLDEALCAYVPVVRERSDRDDLEGPMGSALRGIARSYADSAAARPPRLREIVASFAFVLGRDPQGFFALHDRGGPAQLHHVLCGTRPATLAELASRCDPDARRVLEVAARAARQRVELSFGPRPGADVALTSFDLLRALQVEGALDALREAWSPRFAAATARLRAILALDVDPPPALELDPGWAAHVRAWLHGRPGELDVAALVGGLDLSALGELTCEDEWYVEGLITREEALGRLVERQQAVAGWSARRLWWGAHLDLDGELARLGAAMESSPVVSVRCESPARILPLVQAWAVAAGRPAERLEWLLALDRELP